MGKLVDSLILADDIKNSWEAYEKTSVLKERKIGMKMITRKTKIMCNNVAKCKLQKNVTASGIKKKIKMEKGKSSHLSTFYTRQ